MTEETKPETLDPDAPAKEKDLLERGNFTNTITKYIEIQNLHQQSFTAALYGQWGEGKSSVLNFIKNNFTKEKSEEDGPVKIIEFNPWMYQDPAVLAQAFLREIRKGVISFFQSKEDRKKITAAFEALSVSQSRYTLSGEIGINHFITAKIRGSKSFAKSHLPFSEEKQQLKDLLEKKNFKILILVDDLDRCLPEEILNTLRVIKAVCDLPKMFFLLSCDRDNVAQAIGQTLLQGPAQNIRTVDLNPSAPGHKVFGHLRNQYKDTEDIFLEKGCNYLKKFVQHEFILPKISPDIFLNIFFKRIQNTLKEDNSAPVAQKNIKYDPQQIDHILSFLINDLKDLRNVKRLSNAVSVSAHLLKEGRAEALKANAADLIAIEALRLFHYQDYLNIAENKEISTARAYRPNPTSVAAIRTIKDFLLVKNNSSETDEENFRLNTKKYFDNYFAYQDNSGLNFNRLIYNYLKEELFQTAQKLIEQFIRENGYITFFRELAAYRETHSTQPEIFKYIKVICQYACDFQNTLPDNYWTFSYFFIKREKNTDIADALQAVFPQEQEEDLEKILHEAKSLSLLAALFVKNNNRETIIARRFSGKLLKSVQQKIYTAATREFKSLQKFSNYSNDSTYPREVISSFDSETALIREIRCRDILFFMEQNPEISFNRYFSEFLESKVQLRSFFPYFIFPFYLHPLPSQTDPLEEIEQHIFPLLKERILKEANDLNSFSHLRIDLSNSVLSSSIKITDPEQAESLRISLNVFLDEIQKALQSSEPQKTAPLLS